MLTTQALHDRMADRAIGELLQNARRLAVAGMARRAHLALGLLFEPGSWQLPSQAASVDALQKLMPAVSWLAGEPCPPIGDQPAIPLAAQRAWAEREAEMQLRGLARADRDQLRPAGSDWSPVYLKTLANWRAGRGDDGDHSAFCNFCRDAEFVLKSRVALRFGTDAAVADMPPPEVLKGMGMGAEVLAQLMRQIQNTGAIHTARPAQAARTSEIARALIGYQQATGFDGGELATEICVAAWLLLVDDGRHAEAGEIAAAWIAIDPHALARMLDFTGVEAVARCFQGGSLASVVGVDAAAAQAWLRALRTRDAATAAGDELLLERT